MELTGLKDKISHNDAIIKSLSSTKSAVEKRLRFMVEERDRLAQQNIELFVMKANYMMKTEEIESLNREKKALLEEKEYLIEEIEARKYEV